MASCWIAQPMVTVITKQWQVVFAPVICPKDGARSVAFQRWTFPIHAPPLQRTLGQGLQQTLGQGFKRWTLSLSLPLSPSLTPSLPPLLNAVHITPACISPPPLRTHLMQG